MATQAHSLVEIEGIELAEEIARGASSVVYLGIHEGRKLAVKLARARPRGTSSESQHQQFIHEAISLARIRHPILPEIFVCGESGGLPYIAMELIEGRSLASLLEEEGAMAPAEAARIGIMLARGLEEVHRHGVVHRDLKPHNIMIEKNGNVRLIDFGLAVNLDDTDEENDRHVGTFLYSAPEQTGMLNRSVDHRADLYSLGVVLFECLTGKTPFNAADIGELMRQHVAVQPPKVTDLRPDLNPDLSRVIDKLLAKDVEDRYQTGLGLADDLERIGRNLALKELGSSDFRRDERSPGGIPLIGRTSELERLRAAWTRTSEGSGGLWLISGEPGAGKSRLASELAFAAADANALVLRGKFTKGAVVPFLALREALDSFFADLNSLSGPEKTEMQERVKAAAGRSGGIIRDFIPAFAEFLPEDPSIRYSGDLQEQFLHALAEVFLALPTPGRPVLFLIDDLQWCDGSSLEVLKKLVARLHESRILIGFTARSDAESRGQLDPILGELGTVNEIKLEPLDSTGVLKLASAYLGGAEPDPEMVSLIFSRTQGSPMAVLEYLKAMLQEGLLRPHWGKWEFDRSGLEKLGIPGDIIQLVMRRAQGLSSTARDILSIAAVMGSRFDLPVLVRVADSFQPAQVQRALEEALHATLIETLSATEFRFVHDRIQEAMVESLGPGDEKNIHERIAEELEKAGQNQSEAIFRIADHRSRGLIESDPSRARAANFAAGKAALRNFSSHQAYGYLRAAEDITRRFSVDSDPDIQVALGDVCVQLGRVEEAVQYLTLALESVNVPLTRAEIRGRLSRAFLSNLDTARAAEQIDLAFREIKVAPPSFTFLQVIRTLCGYTWGLVARWIGRTRRVTGKKRELVELLVRLNEQAGITAFFNLRTHMLLYSALRTFGLVHRLGPSREFVYNYGNYAGGLSVLKFRRRAELEAARMMQVADQIGDPTSIAHSRAYHAFCAVFYGAEREAERRLKSTLEEYHQWLDTEDYVNLCGCLMSSLLLRGYPDDTLFVARRAIQVLNSRTGGTGTMRSHFLTWMYSYSVASLAMKGQVSEGLEYLDSIDRYFQDHPDDRYHRGIHLNNLMQLYVEQRESGENVEAVVRERQEVRLPIPLLPLHIRHFYVSQAYQRLAEFHSAADERRTECERKLRKAIFELTLASDIPMLRAHLCVVKGAYAGLRGKVKQSAKLFSRGETLANETDNRLALFEMYRYKAHLLQAGGDELAAQRNARLALQMAQESGWISRIRWLKSDFKLSAPSQSASHGTAAVPSQRSDSGVVPIKQQRLLDALLQVSLVSTSMMDSESHSKNALAKVIEILGAERGFLFLEGPQSGGLKARSGRDSEGRDIESPSGFSRSVIDQVWEEGKPVIFSGGEDDVTLGSESIMAYGLRSIIAAPVRVRDRSIGVLYLDNRLVRGVFTEQDIEILTAIGNHIGIGIEANRMAQVEIEKRTLEKDLEVTGAVQSMLVPALCSYVSNGLKVEAYYQSAVQSGGDWWRHELLPDGRVRLFIGDVSGHGAGAAMVTAMVASAFEVTCGKNREPAPIRELFSTVDQILVNLCRREYSMTLLAIEIDSDFRKARIWSAGAPPAIQLSRASDETASRLLMAPGMPLGMGSLSLGEREAELAPGDRLFLFTDGAFELDVNGRQLRLKGLLKLINSVSSSTDELALVRDRWVEEFSKLCGAGPLEDDVSLVIVETPR